jgi:hypothetical protein
MDQSKVMNENFDLGGKKIDDRQSNQDEFIVLIAKFK